mmetsp:Transcript_743/g.616  ORF Transcript_743/g.616 Transcript_743/m.616 type:complete len:171 (+) Transcript_743:662-1174(+)
MDRVRVRELDKVMDRLKHTLKISHNSSQVLLGLVEDILDLTKMEAGTFSLSFSNFKISELMFEMNDFFQDQCKQKRIDLKFEMDENLNSFEIYSDRNRLRQVFMNLLTNSVKFTFQGHIYIKTFITQINQESFIEFSIEDTGIGIKEEDQNKLFKLFGMASDNGEINPNG